ncbi:MAG: histidine phosphatase family protein [Propionibacteriaceae bacterium]|jgi:hypothetical protein|nr:histidine phosphatase family protein [Propionibacteriaceae bacterium]
MTTTPTHRGRARRVGLALVTATALASLSFATAAGAGTYNLSSKAPYPAPASTVTYTAAPDGYTPIYTESVDRHGSRGLSGYKYDALLMLMAKTALAEGGFQSAAIGQAFIANLNGITAANVENGYGLLTGQGRDQLKAIGQRAYERNKTLFTAAASAGGTIVWETSGEGRATESGQSFQAGFAAAGGSAIAGKSTDFAVRPDLLYFHKIENPDGTKKAEGTAAYTIAAAFEDYVASDKVAAVEDFAADQDEAKQVANDLLLQIFTQDFIDKIGQDAAHTWYNTVDGTKTGATNCAPNSDPTKDPDACGDPTKKISKITDAAEYIYECMITQADMPAENVAPHTFDFTTYFAGHEEDSEWFAYLLDVGDFYEKGPGFAGQTDSFQDAQPLLDDFFKAIDDRVAGGTVVATYRFGHAETVVPFAALLRLPGYTKQAPNVTEPKTLADIYTYDAYDFRSATAGPMAVNVQWDVVAKSGTDPATGKAYTPLVRVLFNEVEVPVYPGQCTPIAAGSPWYKLTELKRCLNGTATTESPTLTVTASASPTPAAATTAGIPTGNTGSPLATDSNDLIAGAAALVAVAIIVTMVATKARRAKTR